jgi:hypothetical protein
MIDKICSKIWKYDKNVIKYDKGGHVAAWMEYILMYIFYYSLTQNNSQNLYTSYFNTSAAPQYTLPSMLGIYTMMVKTAQVRSR